jgi:hypothetical protein
LRILFVDHAFHKTTRSSDFFRSLLERHFVMDTVYFDPRDEKGMTSLRVPQGIGLVVLWQMDFLAPLFLAQGVPTVVVPMFDGSSQLPDLHWIWAQQARFINFSRWMHDRVHSMGGTSLLVKYFLPPVPESKRARFDGLRVLLWQRRPEDGINLGLVERMFGGQLKSVHVHNVPDDPEVDTSFYLRRSLDTYALTISSWFPDRTGFERLLDTHNVLIAPRMSEGIGMTMLEAFSRGMLVLAADAPTHDEYIANHLNGVLFNVHVSGWTDFSEAPAMGELAWRTAAEGFARWKAKEVEIVDFVRSTPRPRAAVDCDVPGLALRLVRAYLGGSDVYKTHLLTEVPLIERMCNVKLFGHLDEDGHYRPERPSAAPRGNGASRELAWLDQQRFGKDSLGDARYVLEGRTKLDGDVRWVLGQGLMLGFRIDPNLGAARKLRLRYRLPQSAEATVPLCVILNGITLGMVDMGEPAGTLELAVPAFAVRVDNRLQLQSGSSHFKFGDPVGFGIESIELE